MGMPVRRVRALSGDCVYASRADLDAWLAARSLLVGSHGDGDGDAGEPEGASRRPRPWPGSKLQRWGVVLLGCAIACSSTWCAMRKGAPARWTAEGGVLTVMDQNGRRLWTRLLPLPLNASAILSANSFLGPAGKRVAFSDIDGDGGVEVLVTVPTGDAEAGLFCFESGGALRFRHSVSAVAQYGSGSYGPPWSTTAVLPSRRSGVLWAVSSNTFFPSVVQKLTARGEVLAEYSAPRPRERVARD